VCDYGAWDGCVADPSPQITVVSVTPSPVTVPLGLSVPLGAIVTGPNPAVSWSVEPNTGTFVNTSSITTIFTPIITGEWHPKATSQANPASSASGDVVVPRAGPYNDPGQYPPTAGEILGGSNNTAAGVYGGSYIFNLWFVYGTRGGSADHYICNGTSRGFAVPNYGSGCVVPDKPGDQVSLGITVNLYESASNRTRYVASLPEPAKANVSHVDQKRFFILFAKGSAPFGFPGVDNISGVCSTFFGDSNFYSKGAVGSYLQYCGY
jgi:hypothetical protein